MKFLIIQSRFHATVKWRPSENGRATTTNQLAFQRTVSIDGARPIGQMWVVESLRIRHDRRSPRAPHLNGRVSQSHLSSDREFDLLTNRDVITLDRHSPLEGLLA